MDSWRNITGSFDEIREKNHPVTDALISAERA